MVGFRVVEAAMQEGCRRDGQEHQLRKMLRAHAPAPVPALNAGEYHTRSSPRLPPALCPSLQVMSRLDGVDPEVRDFFAPVARLVLASRDPQVRTRGVCAAMLPDARG